MSRLTRARKGPEWIGLGEASRLLGVAPGTLRRWSDNGRVSAFTTPGGHRRYRRTALERLLPADRIVRPSLALSGVTTGRLARAYRQEARRATRQLPWLVELSEEQRDWFRTHGRRLAELLLAHLDESPAETGSANVAEATAEAAGYGRMAAGLGISLSQTVEGFLQFRRPFLHELALFAGRRSLDAFATTELMEATEKAMDRLLIATMNAYTVERVGKRQRFDTESEGLR